jgi:cytochrome oxidase assembly protein ShyY1
VRTFLFSPRWLALHVVAIVLVAVFVGLGWWQLDAYRTSEDRHDARESDPIPVTELIDPAATVEQPVDRPVTADGSYLDGLIVPARIDDGVLGAFAVGMLDTRDGVLIVLRGWVPTADDVPAAPSGRLTVTGYVMPAETSAQATGRPTGEHEIGYLAPDAVTAATGQDDLYDGFLIVADEQPAPAAAPERIDIDEYAPVRNVGPWQNLSYWAQWWVFAAAVIIFWISFIRTGIRRWRRTPEPAPDAPHGSLPRPSAPRRTT